MPVRVKVGEAAIVAAVREEVRPFPPFPFRFVHGLVEPPLPCGREVDPHHLRCLPLDATGHFAGYREQQRVAGRRLRREPLAQSCRDVLVERLRVGAPAFAVNGLHGHCRLIRLQVE
ncbi:MAG: hypothetical protein M3552_04215 [Planctomycetota bacterium]|nr:hypothetical protein [Planctomycetota bacterium]